MNEKYAIVLKSPMGPKKGELTFIEYSEPIQACLECLGKSHLMSGTLNAGSKLFLEGILKSPLGEEPFEIMGILSEDTLTGSFNRRGQKYELLGLKIEK